mmetsp:Transcript_98234/g.174036  ORF Transcript_98234/g.174036 Transcript_98234/m.174036 type:complete len:524 (+) Transcript_98234:73-1644(+)
MALACAQSMDANMGECPRPAKRLRTKTNVEGRHVKLTSRTSEHPLWLREASLIETSGLLCNLLETFDADNNSKTLDLETEVVASARLTPAACELLPRVLQWLAGQATFTPKQSNVSDALELADFLLCDKLSDAVFTSNDPKVRKRVAVLFAERGEEVAHHAAQLLAWAKSDASALVRTAAKEALASIWSMDSISTGLFDSDAVVREIAVLQIYKRSVARVKQPAVEWKDRLHHLVRHDPHPAVQSVALLALIATDGLERTFQKFKQDPSFRMTAVSAIGFLYERAKPDASDLSYTKPCLQWLLLWARDDESRYVRRAAMSALVKTGAARELANRFNSSDAREREIAIAAFGQLGQQARPYAGRVLEQLHNELAPSVVRAGVKALVNLGVADQYIEELLDVMQGGKLSVQLAVVAAFAKASASAKLAACLDASHAGVRKKAAVALGDLGEKACAFAGDLLKRVENDTAPSVRRAAAVALTNIGSVDELRAASQAPDADVREVVQLGLWELGEIQEMFLDSSSET